MHPNPPFLQVLSVRSPCQVASHGDTKAASSYRKPTLVLLKASLPGECHQHPLQEETNFNIRGSLPKGLHRLKCLSGQAREVLLSLCSPPPPVCPCVHCPPVRWCVRLWEGKWHRGYFCQQGGTMRAPGYSLCLNWCPGAASFPSSIQAVPRVASHLSEGGGREGCVPSHLRAGEKREPSPASLVKLHVESHPQTQRAGAATQSQVHLPSGGLVTCSPSSSSEGGE